MVHIAWPNTQDIKVNIRCALLISVKLVGHLGSLRLMFYEFRHAILSTYCCCREVVCIFGCRDNTNSKQLMLIIQNCLSKDDLLSIELKMIKLKCI